jgi:hypothetical protein
LTISIQSHILIWPIGGCDGCKKEPLVSSISPDRGSEKGGDTVTITGDKFKDGATVSIGGNPATNVNVMSQTEITAVTPPGTAGTTVGIEVRNEGVEEPGTLENAYTYLDTISPEVASTTPGDGDSPEYEDTVNTGITISATFSEPIQSGSVTMAVAMETLPDLTWAEAKSGDIPGTVNYDSDTTVNFAPDAPLKAARKYTVTISGATDEAGNEMEGTYTFSFELKTPQRVHFYVAKEGDDLKSIADRPETYDNEGRWQWILEVNQDSYEVQEGKDNLLISKEPKPGQKLIIPWWEKWQK